MRIGVPIRRCGIFLALLLITSRSSCTDALTIPSRIRVDSNGKPRLAWLAGKMIGLGTRVGLLARSAKSISVNVDAYSNRAVLRGELKELSIMVNSARGPMLQISKLQLKGSDLRLGWWPLLYSSAPIVWMVIRPSLLFVVFSLLLYSSMRRHNSEQQNNGESLLETLREKLDGKPCSVNYQVYITDQDVANSNILQIGLESVLRSLMLNSVLGVAAAAADTMQIIQSSEEGSSKKPSTQVTNLLLNPADEIGSTTGQDIADDEVRAKEPQMLMKLLEATDFQLINTTFCDKRLYLNADAVYPETEGQTRLSYTLRTSLQPTVFDNQHALVFASPECRFSLGSTIGGPLGKFLPELWLPVGPGVSLSLGLRHRIQRVNIAAKESCTIQGQLSFFKKEPMGFGERVLDSLLQQPPLPFSTKGKPRALPPAKK